MSRPIRAGAMIGIAVVALLGGIWFGEDPSALVHPLGLLGLGVLGAAGAYLVPAGGVPARIIGAIMILAAGAAGYVGGRYESTVALQEAVGRGESLRDALAEYRERHGVYPERLQDLSLRPLPGNLLLRGTIVGYERTESGYQITFRDWMVTWSASHTEPFTATQ